MDAMVPRIQQVMDDLIDEFPAAGGSFDLFDKVANLLPAQMIHDLLGIPEESRSGLLRWTNLEVAAGHCLRSDAVTRRTWRSIWPS